MMAVLHSEAFDDDDWVFETKYDGYRAMAICDGNGGVNLYSRNLLQFNTAYPVIASDVGKIPFPCHLDGEIVVEDAKGVSRFQLLQNYRSTGKGKLKYYIFDILQLQGKDVTELPLIDRKQLLKLLLKQAKLKNCVYSEEKDSKGKLFFKQAQKKGQEGIIAKRKGSYYHVGKRVDDWRKIKITNEQEAIIIGITDPQGSRKHFGSILLGVYEKGKLQYIGNCGTGFNDESLSDLYKKLSPLFTANPPVAESIKRRTAVQWIKPNIVCQVKFGEWTKDGHMRQPVFLGLRKDKKAKEVIREKPVD